MKSNDSYSSECEGLPDFLQTGSISITADPPLLQVLKAESEPLSSVGTASPTSMEQQKLNPP